jgi:hypothetical protein
VVGTAYCATVTATYGSTPYSWDHTGSLPPGLSAAQVGNGYVISGTPTSGGLFWITFTVTGANLSTSTKQLSISVPRVTLWPQSGFWTYVSTDSTLTTLTGHTAQNNRIVYGQVPDNFPGTYLEYLDITPRAGGTNDGQEKYATVQLIAAANNPATVRKILARLGEMFDFGSRNEKGQYAYNLIPDPEYHVVAVAVVDSGYDFQIDENRWAHDFTVQVSYVPKIGG